MSDVDESRGKLLAYERRWLHVRSKRQQQREREWAWEVWEGWGEDGEGALLGDDSLSEVGSEASRSSSVGSDLSAYTTG